MEMKTKKKNQNLHDGLIPQGTECKFSFWNLYKAAQGKEISKEEKNNFINSSQEEKNNKIKKWVAQAQWTCEDRIGSDGMTYTAFAPKLSI